MSLIRATCNDCGDVELRSRDLTVNQFVDNNHNPIKSEYCFNCPVCRMIETKSADDQVVEILAAAGVKVKEIVISQDMLDHAATIPSVAAKSNVTPLFGEAANADRVSTPPISENEMIDLFRPDVNGVRKLDAMLEEFLEDPIEYGKDFDPLSVVASGWYNVNAAIETHIANKPETERVVAEIQALGLTGIDTERIVTELRRFPNVPTEFIAHKVAARPGTPISIEEIAEEYYSTLKTIESDIEAKRIGTTEHDQVHSVLEGSTLPPGIVRDVLAIAELHPIS